MVLKIFIVWHKYKPCQTSKMERFAKIVNGIPEKWDTYPKVGPYGMTLRWDPQVGPSGGTLRWDPRIGPLSLDERLKNLTNMPRINHRKLKRICNWNVFLSPFLFLICCNCPAKACLKVERLQSPKALCFKARIHCEMFLSGHVMIVSLCELRRNGLGVKVEPGPRDPAPRDPGPGTPLKV